jgi:hypothetical protein
VAVGGRLIDAGGSGLKANVSGDAEFVIGARQGKESESCRS